MANIRKTQLLGSFQERFGELKTLAGSQSLFTLGAEAACIYVRYSKIHKDGRAFFGLREVDLRQLEGRNSFICFLLDDGSPPLFVPYADFEEVFHTAQVAKDGQYKVQLISQRGGLELYVARQGRFNVEAYVGFDALGRRLEPGRLREAVDLSHSQVQALLAGIGHVKGYDVYVPENDASKLDWSLAKRFTLRESVPVVYHDVKDILSEIDVVWVASGKETIEGLFEVEHSTPIYSGLLRFNDILLTEPKVLRFSIVSNDTRRGVFARQVTRPTFRKSGLSELVSFLEYANVMEWYRRLGRGETA